MRIDNYKLNISLRMGRGLRHVLGRVTVKVAAVERRSLFSQRINHSDYVGIEPGADTAAAIDLDEHLVDEAEGMEFFMELLYSTRLCNPQRWAKNRRSLPSSV
jgi:hypothetical protein